MKSGFLWNKESIISNMWAMNLIFPDFDSEFLNKNVKLSENLNLRSFSLSFLVVFPHEKNV